ncbi:MAG: hypothetical protein HQM12_18570 [SAR324 cluster bacterium]|nr:hypothetical protein [SAR324 cluster bacterium]
MKQICAWIGMILGLIVAISVSARPPTNMEYCAAMGDAFFQKNYFRVGGTEEGFIKETSGFANYKMQLYAAMQYGLLACGDETFEHLDLQIYDDKGNMLMKHDEPINSPIFVFRPPADGVYFVVVYANTGYGNFVFLKMYRE